MNLQLFLIITKHENINDAITLLGSAGRPYHAASYLDARAAGKLVPSDRRRASHQDTYYILNYGGSLINLRTVLSGHVELP